MPAKGTRIVPLEIMRKFVMHKPYFTVDQAIRFVYNKDPKDMSKNSLSSHRHKVCRMVRILREQGCTIDAETVYLVKEVSIVE